MLVDRWVYSSCMDLVSTFPCSRSVLGIVFQNLDVTYHDQRQNWRRLCQCLWQIWWVHCLTMIPSHVDPWLLGSLARIGPNQLVTNDYELIRRMCGARSRYVRDDSFVASRFDPPNDHVGSTINEKKHSDLRAKLSVGVSFCTLIWRGAKYIAWNSTQEKMFQGWRKVLTSSLWNW